MAIKLKYDYELMCKVDISIIDEKLDFLQGKTLEDDAHTKIIDNLLKERKKRTDYLSTIKAKYKHAQYS